MFPTLPGWSTLEERRDGEGKGQTTRSPSRGAGEDVSQKGRTERRARLECWEGAAAEWRGRAAAIHPLIASCQLEQTVQGNPVGSALREIWWW